MRLGPSGPALLYHERGYKQSTRLARLIRQYLDMEGFGVGRDSYTEVESDHRAFLWWAPLNLAVIPAVRYDG